MKFFQKCKQLIGKKPSKKMMSITACVLLIAVLGSSAGIYLIKADTKEKETGDTEVPAMVEENANSFTEEGTTTMGTISQMPEFALNRALMYVEEVYVAAGDTVAEGDALFKIADDSMEDAKAYYKDAITKAEDTLTEAQVAYESGKLDAEYIKLDAETTAENAAATLETGLANLDDDIEEKYEKWQSAKEKLATYNDALYNNLFYTGYGIPEKDAAATEAKTAYEKACATYATTYEEAKASYDNAVLALIDAVNNAGDTTTAASTVADCYTIIQALEPLYETYRTAQQDLKQAMTLYENKVREAENAIEQLEGSIDALQQNYESASLAYETKKLELQKTYETSVLEGKYAETTYNETVEKLKSAVEKAEDTLTDLQEEQAALLALEDGVVCANQSGTLASVTYDAEDVLFSGAAFVTYYDTATLTISVEIEQENIAKVAVGDEVSVTVTGSRRDVTGTVASVASAATTGRSVSAVTYAVVIAIENENNMLSAGSSATVTFEYGE